MLFVVVVISDVTELCILTSREQYIISNKIFGIPITKKWQKDPSSGGPIVCSEGSQQEGRGKPGGKISMIFYSYNAIFSEIIIHFFCTLVHALFSQ